MNSFCDIVDYKQLETSYKQKFAKTIDILILSLYNIKREKAECGCHQQTKRR